MHSITLEPSSPPTITRTEVAADSVYLHWSPPTQENQNGVIIGYTVVIRSVQVRNISIASDSTEYTLEADPYTDYQLSVAAVTSVGQGPFSAAVHVKTLPAGTYEPPQN